VSPFAKDIVQNTIEKTTEIRFASSERSQTKIPDLPGIG